MGKSLEEKIQENHIIFVHSEMNAAQTNKVIMNLMSWNRESEKSEINVYLSAEAWDFINTFAIYDVLKKINNPINIFCIGIIRGLAPVLLDTASKGHRYALKHTLFYLDQPFGGIDAGSVQQTEVEIVARETTLERNTYEEILANMTNKPIEEIHKDTESKRELTAEEAKAYGLIDEILE